MTCAEKIKKDYPNNKHALATKKAFKCKMTLYDTVIVCEYTFVDGSIFTTRHYKYA
jgi:hypothetical protein